MKKLSMLACVAGTMGFGSMASAEAPPASEVYVNSITAGGSGCPQDSYAVNLSEDRQAFTLIFDEYIAETYEGASLRDTRKTCQVNLDLHVPQGWSYTLFDVQTRGYADLEKGVVGTQKSSYYFQGMRRGPSFKTVLRGPYSDDYLAEDKLAVRALVWSKCGTNRALNIKTEVRVKPRGRRYKSAEGLMTVDSIDGEFIQKYGIMWRRCR